MDQVLKINWAWKKIENLINNLERIVGKNKAGKEIGCFEVTSEIETWLTQYGNNLEKKLTLGWRKERNSNSEKESVTTKSRDKSVMIDRSLSGSE